MADLLEKLATSFDTELEEKDRDLAQAHALAANIQNEIVESQRTVGGLQQAASGLEALEARERELVQELENKMGKRFRLGWEKWVRDEDAREEQYAESGAKGEADLDALRELGANPPADAVERARKVRARIDERKEERRELFGEFARLQSAVGTGTRMGQYRQLIALGCGVPMEQVDGVIESLYETLEGREEYA